MRHANWERKLSRETVIPDPDIFAELQRALVFPAAEITKISLGDSISKKREILHNDIVHSLWADLTILSVDCTHHWFNGAAAKINFASRPFFISSHSPAASSPTLRFPFTDCAPLFSHAQREKVTPGPQARLLNSRWEKVKSRRHGFAIFFALDRGQNYRLAKKAKSIKSLRHTKKKRVLCATRDLNSESTPSPQGSTSCTAFCSGRVLGIRYDISFIKASGEKITHSAPKAEEIAFY